MKLLKTLVLLLFSASLYAQKDTTLLENWKPHPITENKDTLLQYNHSPSMIVYREKGKIKVKREVQRFVDDLPFKIVPLSKMGDYDQFSGRRQVLKVDDGYLVGFNHGEFGGSLFWFSSDGARYYRISDSHLQQFILRDREIYAIQGLAHMGSNQGSIMRITKKQKWSAIDYLRLPSAPRAITIDKQNNFLVISSSALLKVDLEPKVCTLISNDNWQYYLHPNSILLDKGSIYLGMQGGIWRYTISSKKQEWFLPH